MKNHNCGASYSVVGNSRAKHLRGNGRLLCAKSGHFESHKVLNLMPIGIVYFTMQTTNSLNRAR